MSNITLLSRLTHFQAADLTHSNFSSIRPVTAASRSQQKVTALSQPMGTAEWPMRLPLPLCHTSAALSQRGPFKHTRL